VVQRLVVRLEMKFMCMGHHGRYMYKDPLLIIAEFSLFLPSVTVSNEWDPGRLTDVQIRKIDNIQIIRIG
jgi:hypothetical protein